LAECGGQHFDVIVRSGVAWSQSGRQQVCGVVAPQREWMKLEVSLKAGAAWSLSLWATTIVARIVHG
jgi:hypothetical protein